MAVAIDHLVIGATTLEQGVAFVREALGVTIPVGGVHESMGTHNHLMQLGDDVFLEVIAVNPAGSKPQQPRWYGLDDPYVLRQLAVSPSLLTWVVNTDGIESLLARASFNTGKAVPVTRGELNWLFGLPDDGCLPGAGMLPYLIEWHTTSHPAARMADCRCKLLSLDIYHPHSIWLTSGLGSIDAQNLVSVHTLQETASVPFLEAKIQTPSGVRTLRSIH